MPASTTAQKPPAKHLRPVSGRDVVTLPPLRGSVEEYAATALAIGAPEAFGVTAGHVQQLISMRLMWEA